MENFSPNGFSPNGKKPKIKSIDEALTKSLEYFVEGNLNIENIEEISIENETRIYFSFNGGGKEIFKKVNNIYQEIKSDPEIPEILRENFGIELDGDKKCFVASFRINENNPDFETLKEKARQELEKTKEKLSLSN
jgi:hypothetical protein